MRIKDAYPSKHLASEDFDVPALATVARCEMQIIGSGSDSSEKPVVYFHEYAKSLVLNKTNFATLAKTLGDDSDEWAGGKIIIYSSTTQYQGEDVACLRLRASESEAVPVAQPAESRQVSEPFTSSF